MTTPKPIEAIASILEWTGDDHDMPDDPRDRLEWYARRLLLIRNAARTVLMHPEI